jgi:hypothetical protein
VAGVVFDADWELVCGVLPALADAGIKGVLRRERDVQRADADWREEGESSAQVLVAAPEGGPRGAAPRAKTSTMIMRPPQQGHGGR